MTAIRKIFISYRQSDNRAFVVRIRDWLVNKYGRDNVFMDFDTLPPFVKFEDFIKQRIAESDVILAIIGDGWLQAFADKAAEGEKDYVLTELETALKSGKLIAPVLIMGAQMPRRRDVPDGLRELCDYNAANLRDDRTFYDEIERVIAALEQTYRDVTPPTSAIDFIKRGITYLDRSDFDRARADFLAAVDLEPNNDAAYHNLGVVYEQIQAWDSALANYSEAIKLNPNKAISYQGRAFVRHSLGDFAGAVLDYTESLRFNPDNVIVLNNRGISREKMNDLTGAIADWQQALRLGHSNPEVIEQAIRSAENRLNHGI